ncbi:unnamed protein product [Phytophthora fragariaefolia]|uniref:Unnamed protein product n=1 Tax=Phytophthora fragariaefolia TaxID=1490495 RepID=A0A9W6XVD3_9STRA|nr:unnamed protein product [Phytophthora fragariaefolia]
MATPSLVLLDDVRCAYANDANAMQLLNYFTAPSDKSRQSRKTSPYRYRVFNDLLLYSAVDDNADRVVVPDDLELKLRITYDTPTSGHSGREKTYLLLTPLKKGATVPNTLGTRGCLMAFTSNGVCPVEAPTELLLANSAFGKQSHQSRNE